MGDPLPPKWFLSANIGLDVFFGDIQMGPWKLVEEFRSFLEPRLMSPDLRDLAPKVANFVMNFQMNLKTLDEVLLEQKQTGEEFRVTFFHYLCFEMHISACSFLKKKQLELHEVIRFEM